MKHEVPRDQLAPTAVRLISQMANAILTKLVEDGEHGKFCIEGTVHDGGRRVAITAPNAITHQVVESTK